MEPMMRDWKCAKGTYSSCFYYGLATRARVSFARWRRWPPRYLVRYRLVIIKDLQTKAHKGCESEDV